MAWMKERDNGYKPKTIQLPPSQACELCANRLKDICLEKCAPKGNLEAFAPRKNIEMDDLPPFPKDWPPKALQKVRDHITSIYMNAILRRLR